MRYTLIIMILYATFMCGCVRPWGKPDPPSVPKQAAFTYHYPKTK